MVSFENALSLVSRYGKNSNSFMVLYPGFAYFESADPRLEGMIAYVDTRWAWLAAAEPFAEEKNQLPLLNEFSSAARAAGKRVLLLPAEQPFAERAGASGFQSILIGSEPVFLLGSYPRSGTSWLDPVPTARQLEGKGALVREFRLEELSSDERRVLEDMTDCWLKSRKTAALGFLNQVKPWLHSSHKKYFSIELEAKVMAFVAAVPIPANKGWYLIDTIRRDNSPAGTTELLMIEAMKKLREQDAELVSFGVAPLSGLEASATLAAAHPDCHRRLYAILRWIFENGNQFYNFKPLFQYKMKFEPTLARPVFMLYGGPDVSHALSIKDVLSISKAWLPKGIVHASGLGALRLVSKISVPDLIKSQLRPGTVVRSVPLGPGRLISRCRLASVLLLSAVAFAPSELPAIAIVIGGLEYLAGTALTAASVLLPAAAFLLVAHFSSGGAGQELAVQTLALGVFGAAGALYWFLRRGKSWLGLFLLLGALGYFSRGWSAHWEILAHWASLALGVLVAKVLLRA